MPEFVPPGVYIEELEQGPRPIEGVPTSNAAFLGETERGPLRPRLVTSYTEYTHWFGGVFADGRYMPHAVSGFFENGGKRLYVCRIVGAGATTASKAFGDFTVTAAGPGAWGRRVWVRIQDGSTGRGGQQRLQAEARVLVQCRRRLPASIRVPTGGFMIRVDCRIFLNLEPRERTEATGSTRSDARSR